MSQLVYRVKACCKDDRLKEILWQASLDSGCDTVALFFDQAWFDAKLASLGFDLAVIGSALGFLKFYFFS